jgi:hypothetical protein
MWKELVTIPIHTNHIPTTTYHNLPQPTIYAPTWISGDGAYVALLQY